MPNCELFTTLMDRISRLICQLILFLTLSSAAKAQWLVYELTFQEEAGSVNFSFYSGAYVVAPIDGGAASIVFTTEVGGPAYAVSENSMRYFIAANQGVRQGALSAFSINGTATALYNASGNLDTTVEYIDQGVRRTIRVAGDMTGSLLAADDESFQTPASDGSLGMIGRASIAGALRPDLTDVVNQTSVTMSDAVAGIVALLEKYGYRADVGDLQDVPSEPTTPVMDQSPAPESSAQEEAASNDISSLFGGHPFQSLVQPSLVRKNEEVIDPSLFPADVKEEP
jgi:hypothetical protein